MHIFTYLTEINILRESLLHANDFFALLKYFNCCFTMLYINMKKAFESTKFRSRLSITQSNSAQGLDTNLPPSTMFIIKSEMDWLTSMRVGMYRFSVFM